MKTKIKNCVIVSLGMLIISCGNSTLKTESKTTDSVQSFTKTDTVVNQPVLKGDFCFMKALNKDTTTVRIRILSEDNIRGEMIWNPWEKDGAVGSLSGRLNGNKELELIYEYTIEGNRQTETKTMKIQNGKLYLKNGELIDEKNNGNLTYKNSDKAAYDEVLNAVNCY